MRGLTHDSCGSQRQAAKPHGALSYNASARVSYLVVQFNVNQKPFAAFRNMPEPVIWNASQVLTDVTHSPMKSRDHQKAPTIGEMRFACVTSGTKLDGGFSSLPKRPDWDDAGQ